MRVQRPSGEILIPNCEAADDFWKRSRGLLGRLGLPSGSGLWIEPCNSIHTFFMRFAIDAIFIAATGEVLRVYHRLQPWRLSWIHWRARAVLELAEGEAGRLGIKQGEFLHLCSGD